MRVLVAPQEFKGSLSAEEAVDAIAAGIRRARPGWSLDLLPMSDGGPGFVDAMRRATRADTVGIVTHDALGRRLLGRYVVLRDGGTAMIEAAQANGLVHIRPEERDALSAGTFGVGELISAALAGDPPMVVVGVGGSATTDGGAGMARALGARFLDKAEHDLPPGGGPLVHLDRIHWERPIALDSVDFVVATDVTNPLLGPSGAAAVYAPQKGASAEDVRLLERALERYAHVVERDLGISIASLPGGGAAGGLAAGLAAFLGARVVSGFDVVAGATNLAGRLAAASIVVTGEGSFDTQSLQGKTTGRLLEMCRAAGKPCVVLAGRSDTGALTLESLEPGLEASMERAAELLSELAARWAGEEQ
ncbi:MAG: glycerate kinase [Dehalococcoidia bacterium]|nr:glycerate kinase [Chloroflexi bacterium CFX7]MCK6563802.1 glycerate kinase [Dehalococcoidia bacterium]NUQ54885.1 glycerate kinase [Dehalococcoidia bacterium]RIL03746.1 MAG: glycerate kinase [bacterium]